MPLLKDIRFAILFLVILILGIALFYVRPMLVTGSAVDTEGKQIRLIVSGCILCASKRVRVRAEGYESETLYLSPVERFDSGDRVDVSRWLFGLWQHVRVTLFEEQEISYSVIESPLEFSGGAPTVVASIDPKLGQYMAPVALNRQIRKVTKGRELLAAYIMFEADTNEHGEVQTATRPYRVIQTQPYKKTIPEKDVPLVARLTLVNEEGGFVLVDPIPGLPQFNRYSEVSRRLRMAPEGGYEKSVVLDWDQAHLDEGYFFFYCKIGNRYCKGKLLVPDFDPRQRTKLSSNVEIWFNETGTRVMPRGR